MTVQEVIERVRQQKSLVNSLEQDEKMIVLNALEKQIPKEPIDRCMFKECPACHNVEISHCNYCPDCGQALKRDRKE